MISLFCTVLLNSRFGGVVHPAIVPKTVCSKRAQFLVDGKTLRVSAVSSGDMLRGETFDALFVDDFESCGHKTVLVDAALCSPKTVFCAFVCRTIGRARVASCHGTGHGAVRCAMAPEEPAFVGARDDDDDAANTLYGFDG